MRKNIFNTRLLILLISLCTGLEYDKYEDDQEELYGICQSDCNEIIQQNVVETQKKTPA